MTNAIQRPDQRNGEQPPAVRPAIEARRRLLRAAAAAPLLATVPSGSALAQASAFNCVVKPSMEDSDAGVITPSVPVTTTGDPWVRRPAKFRRFFTRQGGLRQFPSWSFDTGLSSDSDRIWYTPGDPNPLSIDWSSSCDPFTAICPLNSSPSSDVRVVAVYLPNDNSFPTSVQAQGYYPVAIPQGEGGAAGNIGLVTSCWCSLQPTHIVVPGPGGDQSPIDAVCSI